MNKPQNKFYQIKESDKVELIDNTLFVNGDPMHISYPNAPLVRIEDGNLVTLFRGHLENYEKLTEVCGYIYE